MKNRWLLSKLYHSPWDPGGSELLEFRLEAFNLLKLYVPNMVTLLSMDGNTSKKSNISGQWMVVVLFYEILHFQYCMVGHHWALSDASIHASLMGLYVIWRPVLSCLMDAQCAVIASQAVVVPLWPLQRSVLLAYSELIQQQSGILFHLSLCQFLVDKNASDREAIYMAHS